jgi:YfiR/HmsC-like
MISSSTAHARWRFAVAKLLLCALLASAWAPLATAALPEYEVKAALLLKIAKFVNWPPEAAARPVFSLCVIGADPFGSALDSIRSQKIFGRRIEVLRLQSSERALNRCHLAFISGTDDKEQRELLESLAASAVLTVSDQPDFARHGGMIGFATRDRKIAFEINSPTYQKVGVEINSQLLRLATIVGNSTEGKQ